MRTILTLLLIIAAALFSGCGKDTNDSRIVLTTGFEEGVLFYIEDSKCYVPEAKVYILNLENGYESVYGDELMSRELDGVSVSDKVSSISLSRLAEVKALGLLAGERNVHLTEKEVSKCSQSADRYFKSLSGSDIKDMEITPELLTSMYQDYALAYKVYDDITKDINPEISDDEARIITIQRILIKNDNEDEALKTANEIYSKLSEGTGFDSLSDEYNQGEEATFSFGKESDMFSRDFIDACFELSTDEVSAPLITEDGVSIVKCLSSYDRERTDANKIRMVEERKLEAFDRVYTGFVKDLNTNFNSELWNEQELSGRKLDSTENFFTIYDETFSSQVAPSSSHN